MCDLTLDFICTYKLIQEDESEPDEVGISELLYNIQYLQTFGLTEFKEDVINHKLDAIYDNMKDESFMQELFENHPYKESMTDELMFRTLFSYDYLDITHKLLQRHFNGLSTDETITTLKEKMLEK